MTGEPVCPLHPWQTLKHTPNDDIKQWECSCGWMATNEFIQSMTPEKMAQIKKEHEDSQRFREEDSARRQADRIEAQMERAQRQGDMIRGAVEKHKNIKPITDYIK